MPRVFISSTTKDLARFRAEAIAAIKKLDGFTPIYWERRGAIPEAPKDFDAREVQSCEYFVGLIGHLHGNSPPRVDRSYTELEYEAAVTKKLKRFMFLLPDDFPVAEDMKESAEKQQRQAAFRGQVRGDEEIIYQPLKGEGFGSDLVSSLTNYWNRQPKPPQSRKVLAGNLHTGEAVHLLCDRIPQETEFQLFFARGVRQQRLIPQVYLLRGPKEELLESLVERFVLTTLRAQSAKLFPQADGGVLPHKPLSEWSTDPDPEGFWLNLLAAVFRTYDAAYGTDAQEDYSAAEFVRLSGEKEEPIHVISHQIHVEEWTPELQARCQRYIEFWDAVGRAAPKVQIVVFLCFNYARRHGAWARLFQKFDPEQIETGFLEIQNARQLLPDRATLCPCAQLDELCCIRPEHVLDWFSHNRICRDEKAWAQHCETLFGGMKCLPMIEVQSALLKIHTEYSDSQL